MNGYKSVVDLLLSGFRFEQIDSSWERWLQAGSVRTSSLSTDVPASPGRVTREQCQPPQQICVLTSRGRQVHITGGGPWDVPPSPPRAPLVHPRREVCRHSPASPRGYCHHYRALFADIKPLTALICMLIVLARPPRSPGVFLMQRGGCLNRFRSNTEQAIHDGCALSRRVVELHFRYESRTMRQLARLGTGSHCLHRHL